MPRSSTHHTTTKRMPYVYIVEADFRRAGAIATWEPTVGAALSHRDAHRAVREWRKKNPGVRFRFARYNAEEPRCGF